MNKAAIETVKQYIIETTDSNSPGISSRAKDCLLHLMKEDRDIAMCLWDRVESLKSNEIGGYVCDSGSGLSDDESGDGWSS